MMRATEEEEVRGVQYAQSVLQTPAVARAITRQAHGVAGKTSDQVSPHMRAASRVACMLQRNLANLPVCSFPSGRRLVII